ncbi:hypothetical protein MJO28_004128 [Puccinia striiformis f. sp. tritici]|uniref:Uncharacterized protein n=1 Tax=Puccinia striiformis f. sp. tritici TaxID=168172 RepID=A0ACC0EMX6_9BASI|nr:hypothetical protein MJO28_004128 [Puccinia striiformis f. sp. tritici]
MAERRGNSSSSRFDEAPRTEFQVADPWGSRPVDRSEIAPTMEGAAPSRIWHVDTNETIDDAPIRQGFKSLMGLCAEITQVDKCRKPAAQEQFIELINTRNNLLDRLRTSFLPSLTAQLAGLLEALDMEAEGGTPPKTDIRTTLQIISEIKLILAQITRSAMIIWPSHHLPILNDNDRDHGFAKTYRCRAVVQKVTELLDEHVRVIMKYYHSYIMGGLHLRTRSIVTLGYPDNIPHEVIRRTTETSGIISDFIRYCNRSDFQLLQDEWQSRAESISKNLQSAYQRLSVRNQREQDGIYNPDGSHDYHPSLFGSSQGSIGLHEELRPNPSNPPHFMILQSVIPLAKLTRILFGKLSTLRGRPPFKLDGMSSADMKLFEDETLGAHRTMIQLLDDACELLDEDADIAFPLSDVGFSIKCRELLKHTEALLVLIELHIVPDSEFDLPQNTFATHFSVWITQSRLAANNFIGIVEEMEEEQVALSDWSDSGSSNSDPPL